MAVQIGQRARCQYCTVPARSDPIRISVLYERFRPGPSVIRFAYLPAGHVCSEAKRSFSLPTQTACNPCTSKICSVGMYPQRVDNTAEVFRLPSDSIQQRDVHRMFVELNRLNVGGLAKFISHIKVARTYTFFSAFWTYVVLVLGVFSATQLLSDTSTATHQL